MEDGLAPGPSKDPLTVLAGEHGVLGEVGEGGGEGLGYCDAEEEEDSVDHVIVIPPPLTPLSALTGVTTTLSSVLQLPARLSLPSGDDKTRLSVTPDSTQINCCIRLSDYPRYQTRDPPLPSHHPGPADWSARGKAARSEPGEIPDNICAEMAH